MITESYTYIEENEGTVIGVVTIGQNNCKYDNRNNVIEKTSNQKVIIYYSDETSTGLNGEQTSYSYENVYDNNGLLISQTEYDNDGNEGDTTYYFWSKGTSIDSPKMFLSTPEWYYDLNGQRVESESLQEGGIYIQNGKKLLIR